MILTFVFAYIFLMIIFSAILLDGNSFDEVHISTRWAVLLWPITILGILLYGMYQTSKTALKMGKLLFRK